MGSIDSIDSIKYKLIVAYCKNRGIGINNSLPWNIRSDLIKFSKLTKGDGNNAIVMGKNTWISLPIKPLKKRDNLILSKSIKLDNEREISTENSEIIKSFDCIEELNKYCLAKKYKTVWIIGGYQIYKEFIERNMVDEIYVTYIDQDYECDTYFPDFFDQSKWDMIKKEQHNLSLKNEYETKHELFNKIFDEVYIKK